MEKSSKRVHRDKNNEYKKYFSQMITKQKDLSH